MTLNNWPALWERSVKSVKLKEKKKKFEIFQQPLWREKSNYHFRSTIVISETFAKEIVRFNEDNSP